MGSRTGLCINVGATRPDAAEAADLHPSWVRTIVYRFDDLDRWLNDAPNGTQTIALLNSETEGVGNEYHGWPDMVHAFANRFAGRVAAVEATNEWDLLGIPVETVAWTASVASAVLRPHGMKVLLGSVAGSDWVGALTAAATRLRAAGVELDGVCAHPYGHAAQGYPRPGYYFGEVQDAVMTAHIAGGGLPVWVTEVGVKIGEVGGEDEQAEWLRRLLELAEGFPQHVLASMCFFAYSDLNGAPSERGDQAFGLVAEDGRRRPAWNTFAALNGGAEDKMPAGTGYIVGPGVLGKMRELGDQPATDELYHPYGVPGKSQYSETFGKSGRRYIYLFDGNKTLVFSPTT